MLAILATRHQIYAYIQTKGQNLMQRSGPSTMSGSCAGHVVEGCLYSLSTSPSSCTCTSLDPGTTCWPVAVVLLGQQCSWCDQQARFHACTCVRVCSHRDMPHITWHRQRHAQCAVCPCNPAGIMMRAKQRADRCHPFMLVVAGASDVERRRGSPGGPVHTAWRARHWRTGSARWRSWPACPTTRILTH